jgi:pimeloyl-ACP methyl ester carboxylesterase
MRMRMMKAVLLTAAIALLVGIRVGGQSGSRAVTTSALPPASIPTFSTENIGRMAHFYVGGQYVGEPGKQYMDDAMYVEVWVPKQVKMPYPIVMFHGNGQTGAVWQQTPDGRPGWAYYLIDQGYVVYMVDYPARGRSPYVPSVDGPLGMRTAT